MVVVDTSVLVDFFRGKLSESVIQLKRCVSESAAAVTPIIRAEILSGAHDDREYVKLEQYLETLQLLQGPSDLWNLVAQARFRLARKRVQSQLLDLSIAITANHFNCQLLTVDKNFEEISREIPIRLFS